MFADELEKLDLRLQHIRKTRFYKRGVMKTAALNGIDTPAIRELTRADIEWAAAYNGDWRERHAGTHISPTFKPRK